LISGNRVVSRHPYRGDIDNPMQGTTVQDNKAASRPVGRSPPATGAYDNRLEAQGDSLRLAWEAALGAPPVAASLVDELVRQSAVLDAAAGQLLLSTQQPAEDLVLLVRGDAVIGSVQAGSGGVPTFAAQRSVSAPAWLDASSAFRDGAYVHDVQATTDVLALRLPAAAALRLVGQQPEFALRLLRVLADRIDHLSQATRDLLHKDAEARFAVWLVQRLPTLADDVRTTTITLTERKRDIATQLGVTPETLSRLLRALTRKGLIEVVGYRVQVLDVPALRRLSAD
jgi:CRP/FNR family transcriptional regulator, dissimilatory nitrate respiration regulator